MAIHSRWMTVGALQLHTDATKLKPGSGLGAGNLPAEVANTLDEG